MRFDWPTDMHLTVAELVIDLPPLPSCSMKPGGTLPAIADIPLLALFHFADRITVAVDGTPGCCRPSWAA